MKLETFFEKFDQFSDAPGAVAKMRELVLEFAVQGRLVPQHAKDETAHALLEKVTSTAKSTRRDAGESDHTDAPFPIPEAWAWVRLRRVLKKLTDGTHHSPPNGPSGSFMYVTAKNIKTDGVLIDGVTHVSKEMHDEIYSRCDPSFGDILYIKDGATTGIATINQIKEPFSMLSSVALLKPSKAIFNRYLLWAMRSPFFYAETRGAMKGAAITRVTLSVMAASLLPLPPLAEQKRIVAKVDELMTLCDRLEAQQQERETQHAALARASLARFADAPTTANLQFLFHPSYAIPPADLRKSILTLAVQGKLVSQDPSDQLAEAVRVSPRRAEEKKAKWAGQVEEQEQPFQLPPSWKWVRLGDVSRLKHGYAFSSNYFTSEPAPFVLTTPGNFYERGGFRDRESKRKYYSGLVDPEFVFKPGDLIIPMTEQAAGLLGSPAFIPDDGRVYIHNQRLGKFTFSDSIAPEFAFWFFNCDFFRAELARTCTGMKVRHTSPDRVLKVPFPVPPLAEQRRIVAKVEQLMTLVDELETQLAASRAIAANLLSALVAELTGTTRDGKVSAPSVSGAVRRGRPKESQPEITQATP